MKEKISLRRESWRGNCSRLIDRKSPRNLQEAYVDTELVSEMSYESALPADFIAGQLGAGTGVNSFYWGYIDEFAIYTKTLPTLGGATQFTLEAWIKPNIFEEFNAIFTTEEWGTGSVHLQLLDDEVIALSLNAGPERRFRLGTGTTFSVSGSLNGEE